MEPEAGAEDSRRIGEVTRGLAEAQAEIRALKLKVRRGLPVPPRRLPNPVLNRSEVVLTTLGLRSICMGRLQCLPCVWTIVVSFCPATTSGTWPATFTYEYVCGFRVVF